MISKRFSKWVISGNSATAGLEKFIACGKSAATGFTKMFWDAFR